MQEVVGSRQNSRLKKIRRYLHFPQAVETPWVAVEGPRNIAEVSSQRPIQYLVAQEGFDLTQFQCPETSCLVVSPTLFRKLSQLESPGGIIAFFAKPDWSWEQMPTFLLYLDRLQDPGNLGTLFRCVAAVGKTGIVSSPGTVSRFNSKAVRASAGTLFSVPMRESESPKTLRERGYTLVAADPEGDEVLFSAELEPPLAIVIGNEGQGIRPGLMRLAARRVRIPVEPKAPSLNAAIAGALILFEIRRRSEFL